MFLKFPVYNALGTFAPNLFKGFITVWILPLFDNQRSLQIGKLGISKLVLGKYIKGP